MPTVKRVLLFAGCVLIFQGCSKTPYIFLQTNADFKQTKSLISQIDKSIRKPSLADSSGTALTPENTYQASGKYQQNKKLLPKAKINAGQENLPPFRYMNSTLPGEPIPIEKLSKSRTGLKGDKSFFQKVTMLNWLRILKNGFIDHQKPAKGEWILKLLGLFLITLLTILLVSNLSAWAVIGVMVGAILLSLFLTFKLFSTGMFGKIGG